MHSLQVFLLATMLHLTSKTNWTRFYRINIVNDKQREWCKCILVSVISLFREEDGYVSWCNIWNMMFEMWASRYFPSDDHWSPFKMKSIGNHWSKCNPSHIPTHFFTYFIHSKNSKFSVSYMKFITFFWILGSQCKGFFFQGWACTHNTFDARDHNGSDLESRSKRMYNIYILTYILKLYLSEIKDAIATYLSPIEKHCCY